MFTALTDIYTVLWGSLRDIRHNWQSLVAASFFQPLLYLVAFGYGLGRGINVGDVSYLDFVIPGIVALTTFSASFNGVATKLQVDRFYYKCLDELMMTPVSLYSIVIGKALVGVVRGLISSTAVLVVGLILSPTIMISPLFILSMFVSCLVFGLFGVLAAFLVSSHKDMSTFNGVVILPMTFLCGTFFSLNSLPDAGKAFLYVLPLTHSSLTLRAAALGQPFPWLSFVALLGFGAAFFMACMLFLRRISL
jgi:ABC-type multidrug transport system permease subunit